MLSRTTSRSTSELASAEALETRAYKTCAIAPQVVERKFALYRDVLHTYHDYDHEPTKKKVWELSPSCKLNPPDSADIKEQEKHIRPRHVTGLGEAFKPQQVTAKAKLFCFDLSWPTSWAISGYSTLGLCFDTREEAVQWHHQLEDRITTCTNVTSPIASVTGSSTPSKPTSLGSGVQEAKTPPRAYGDSPHMFPPSPPIPKVPSAGLLLNTHKDGEPADPPPESLELLQPTETKPALQADLEPAETGDLCRKRKKLPRTSRANWMPYKQSNGVAIYHNPGNNAGGEFMVSHLVRGCPGACVDAIMDPSGYTTVLGPASSIHEYVTSGTKTVVKLHLEAQGFLGSWLPSRVVVLEQWHQQNTDEDGVHKVLFNSIDPKDAPQEEGDVPEKTSWLSRLWGPVPATVTGCYTISGLAGRGEESDETLITCVLQCDLGGFCRLSSWAYRFMHMLGLIDAFVERILMAGMLVKDEVEQRRFTVTPFNMLTTQPGASSSELTTAASQTLPEPDGLTAEDLGPLADTVSRELSMRLSAERLSLPTLTPRGLSKMQSMLHLPKQPSSGLPKQPSTTLPKQSSAGLVSPKDKDDEFHEAEDEEEEEQQDAGIDKLNMGLSPAGTLSKEYYSETHRPGAAHPFKVRGANYLIDKVKIPAGQPVFALGSVDLVLTDEPVQHVARYLPSIRDSSAPFSFVVQLIIPGAPITGLVITFINEHHPSELGTPPADPSAGGHDWTPFDFLLHRFMNSSTDERNDILKLIPNIAEGSWIVRHSVGTTPVKLGKKLLTTYHVTDRYIEIDVDISQNVVASHVVGLVKGAMRSLVVDLAILLEGREPHELPETLLGNVRLLHVDFASMSTRLEVPTTPPADGRSPLVKMLSRRKSS